MVARFHPSLSLASGDTGPDPLRVAGRSSPPAPCAPCSRRTRSLIGHGPVRVLLPGSSPKLGLLYHGNPACQDKFVLRTSEIAAAQQRNFRDVRESEIHAVGMGSGMRLAANGHPPLRGVGAPLLGVSRISLRRKRNLVCETDFTRVERVFRFRGHSTVHSIFHLTLAANICKMGPWKIAGENRTG